MLAIHILDVEAFLAIKNGFGELGTVLLIDQTYNNNFINYPFKMKKLEWCQKPDH
jgi:hypothetical protein